PFCTKAIKKYPNTLVNSVNGNTGSILNKQQKQRITNIRNAITLNQKFIFVGDLFAGDATMFQQAINEIEDAADYEVALSILKERYALKYDWDLNSMAAKDLFEIIERRFFIIFSQT
ncbi:MAG: hypothetical protein HC817_10645, partial [Saprospiraceae bacterium]|nr:hypothetical protein [Saprospiraceae bacterium]